MTVAVYLPVLATMALGALGPFAVRGVWPAYGAVAFAALAAVSGAATLWALLLLAGTLVDEYRSAPVAEHVPVTDAVAMLAVGALAIAAARIVRTARRRLRASNLISDACAGHDNEIMVLVEPRAQAFAVPPCRARGRRPARAAHVVVTDGMLRALTHGQRRALFAHERAHIALRHDRIRQVADLAAAANPLLVPVARAVAYLCERSADEQAAAEVGDRALVASAVATAALAGGAQHARLAFGAMRIADRVHALDVPPPARRRYSIFMVAAVGIAIVAADIHATGDFVAFLTGFLPG